MNLNTEQYFSTVPEIHAPRSVFSRDFTRKMTFNVGDIVPIFIDECLPGDSMNLHFQVFGRLLNPLVVPIMDELYLETLWFKIPNRLVWSHWVNFCGEQDNPGDSTDYIVPTINSGDNGFAVGSIFDMFGLPVGVPNLEVNSLPLRAYNLCYNQWFRDQNLINSLEVPLGEEDSADNYTLVKSAKIHDFFTSALPFAQKGDPVQLPLGQRAPLYGGVDIYDNGAFKFESSGGTIGTLVNDTHVIGSSGNITTTSTQSSLRLSGQGIGEVTTGSSLYYNSGLAGDMANNAYADLSAATGATIADFRFAIKLQQYRERCALGGTRYIEWVKTFYNVDSPDARLQRTEFLGSTREMIDINTVVQTSSSDNTSPQGNLTAYGVVSHHGSGFRTSFTEHSYLLGVARIRHNPIYQQGLYRMWKRKTLLDFYLPVFNGISEQPIPNSDIYCQGGDVVDANNKPIDDKAFGFQEAWAEYRYRPSEICGVLRSGVTGSLDVYHLAQYFNNKPELNQSFIEENIPMDRVLAINTEEEHSEIPQFVFDFRFIYDCARPMPVRNIPAGLSDGGRF